MLPEDSQVQGLPEDVLPTDKVFINSNLINVSSEYLGAGRVKCADPRGGVHGKTHIIK